MDFMAATSLRFFAVEHKKGVSWALAENAFNALSHFLHSKVEGGIFLQICPKIPLPADLVLYHL